MVSSQKIPCRLPPVALAVRLPDSRDSDVLEGSPDVREGGLVLERELEVEVEAFDMENMGGFSLLIY